MKQQKHTPLQIRIKFGGNLKSEVNKIVILNFIYNINSSIIYIIFIIN